VRYLWGEDGFALPTPTANAVSFTDHKRVRIILFLLFLIAGILVEKRCQNKILTGTFHSVYLILCVIIGFYFLLACILPFIPMT
jgi:hypothetical protein